MSRLFEDVPEREKDAVYAATQKFAQLLRGKSPAETAAILEIARTAARHYK